MKMNDAENILNSKNDYIDKCIKNKINWTTDIKINRTLTIPTNSIKNNMVNWSKIKINDTKKGIIDKSKQDFHTIKNKTINNTTNIRTAIVDKSE